MTDTIEINEVTNAWNGLTVYKEGRSTGLTWGQVTNTCANTNQNDPDKGTPTGRFSASSEQAVARQVHGTT